MFAIENPMFYHYRIMLISSVNAKGQITIPIEIRTKMNIYAGDSVVFSIQDNGILIDKIKPFDYEYHKALFHVLLEWNSKEDDEAYCDL